jgi:hypothetical protein
LWTEAASTGLYSAARKRPATSHYARNPKPVPFVDDVSIET